MYDINAIKDRLVLLRKDRYKQYKENMSQSKNPYEKYSCCKSQIQLAEKLGVERRTIGSWENGKTFPDLENLIDLSQLLDCSIEYLLGTGDLPEVAPVSLAAKHSNISPIIIKYGLSNPEYLDFLNYFMLPENCDNIFNNISISSWKTYWINQELSEIKDPLKTKIKEIFNTFNAMTPFNELSKKSYKSFLVSKLPEDELVFSTNQTKHGINIKACMKPIQYQKLSLSQKTNSGYDDFISYLVEYTYEPLINSIVLEIQKDKISKAFISVLNRYFLEMSILD